MTYLFAWSHAWTFWVCMWGLFVYEFCLVMVGLRLFSGGVGWGVQHFITCHAITGQQSEKATTTTWLKDKTQDWWFFKFIFTFSLLQHLNLSITHACSTTNSLSHPSVWKKRKIHYYWQSLLRLLLPNYAAHGELSSLPLFTSEVCGALEKSVFSTFPRKAYFQPPPPTPLLCCSLFFPASTAPAQKKSSGNYPTASVCVCVCACIWFESLFWALI